MLVPLMSLYYSAPSIRFAALIREIRDAGPLPVFCNVTVLAVLVVARVWKKERLAGSL